VLSSFVLFPRFLTHLFPSLSPSLHAQLIALSALSQLLTAFFSLGVCGKTAVGATAAVVALEPGKRSGRRRRGRGRYARVVEGDEEEGDEEEGMGLTGRGDGGMRREEEEEALRESFDGGKGDRRRGLSRGSRETADPSDEELEKRF
jgi:hypothetical protein